MQFTPQQLAGSVSYNPKTRVGNWVEDICLQDYHQAHFEDKKNNGSLELQRRRAKLGAGNAPVAPGVNPDSLVCFGDVVCLDHSGGLRLACDIWDELMPGKAMYSVSAVGGKGSTTCADDAVARTCFLVVPAYDDRSLSPEDPTPVTYGEPFRLQSLLKAGGEDVAAGLLEQKPTFYLASAAKTQYLASRLTNRQLVFALGGTSPETLWVFDRAVTHAGNEAAEDKFFSQGQAVESGAPVVIKHKITNQALLADPKQIEHTDFGAEYEVVCQTSKPPAMVAAMRREAQGSAILASTSEGLENHWAVTKVL
mmetsp:Transcript_31091/g.69806  ORF Transcript_31091/g.69806 Transcript_31091/m.69806 type:complete len:310 (+) Transcript_31091:51-980(+)